MITLCWVVLVGFVIIFLGLFIHAEIKSNKSKVN